MKQILFTMIALCGLTLTSLSAYGQASSDDLKQWGFDALRLTKSTFWLPTRGLYADEVIVGQPASPDRPAFMWGCGVQLSALAAATRVDKAYEPQLRQYADNLDRYWMEANGVGGY